MKFSIYLFFGLIAVLSGFYLISPSEFQISNFNQVFAQSEDKNNNFEDIIITQSSKTTTNEKIKDNDGENRNFQEAILSQSSDTSTTLENKEKISFWRFTNESPKIHPAIIHILKQTNPQAMAKTFGASIDNDKIVVYVHLADKKIQNKSLNIEILGQDENIIVSKLTLSQIRSLANMDSVKRITLPEPVVFYDHGQSEGVSFSSADDLHAAGFNGTGVTVAVIDDSFFTNNTQILSNIAHSQLFDVVGIDCGGELSCGQLINGSHGTAVAEIVVDIAPGVDLLLYTIVKTPTLFSVYERLFFFANSSGSSDVCHLISIG